MLGILICYFNENCELKLIFFILLKSLLQKFPFSFSKKCLVIITRLIFHYFRWDVSPHCILIFIFGGKELRRIKGILILQLFLG